MNNTHKARPRPKMTLEPVGLMGKKLKKSENYKREFSDFFFFKALLL